MERYLSYHPLDRQKMLTRGMRNSTVLSVACCIQKNFYSVDELAAALRPYTDLSESELQQICKNAWKYR